MPEMNLGGMTVNLSVDELLELVQKAAGGQVTSVPAIAARPEPVPVIDATADEIRESIDLKRRVEQRVAGRPTTKKDNYHTRLVEMGYTNTVTVRAIVRGANTYMAAIGSNDAGEWCLQQDSNTVQVLNVFGAEAANFYARVADDKKNFWAPGLGISFWVIEDQLGFNAMMSAVAESRKAGPLYDKLADAHDKLISDYIVERYGIEKLGTQARHKISWDVKETIITATTDLILDAITA